MLRCLAGAALTPGVFGGGSAKHGTSGSSWWVGGMLASRGDPRMQLGTTKQLSSTQWECTGRSKESERGSKHARTVPTGLAAAVKSAWQFCQTAWISQTASQKGTEKQGAKSSNFSKVCVKCHFPIPSLPQIREGKHGWGWQNCRDDLGDGVLCLQDIPVLSGREEQEGYRDVCLADRPYQLFRHYHKDHTKR